MLHKRAYLLGHVFCIRSTLQRQFAVELWNVRIDGVGDIDGLVEREFGVIG